MPPDNIPPDAPLDLAAIRRRLSGEQDGRRYWRSLEELADSPRFAEFLHAEFPREAAHLESAVDRRQFLQLMSASLALAGLSACTRQPEERVVPYVRQPERLVLGEPLFYATACTSNGLATGLLVESHEGRPTKVEGNPEHPASLGASDPLAQASILGLYDPDRSQVITSVGEIRPWGAFREALAGVMAAQAASGGAGVRLLTETVTSPTLAGQIRRFLSAFPQARWHQWEPTGRDAARAGARLAFGTDVETRYQLADADVVVTLDADPLGAGPSWLRHVRQWASRRRPNGDAALTRLYAVESTPTVTGAVADHRLPVRATDVEAVARAIAAGAGLRPRSIGVRPAVRDAADWLDALVQDLLRHRGRSVVIPGEQQSPVVHALAHALNQALGNVGRTVVYTEPVEAEPADQMASLRRLSDDMQAGAVQVLVVLGANPVYTAPADLDFAARMDKVGFRVHLGAYEDETAVRCHWHVPEAHFLEAWSDARAHDGTATIVQPLIAPLYGGRSAHDVLAILAGEPDRPAHDVVQDYWKSRHPGPDFDDFWRKALHDGMVPGTSAPTRRPSLRPDWDTAETTPPPAGLEIVFRPDPFLGDGRFANNGWLQELPRPLTKLVWDNAALIAPATAERLGLASGDVVELRYRDGSVGAPVWLMPGHAADSVTVHLGWGRRRAGRVGNGRGFDAYALRTSDAPWFATGLAITRTSARVDLACTQDHQSMEGRPLVRSATIEEYRAHPEFAREMEEQPHDSLYPGHRYDGYAWGMAIDLSTCVGCNACVSACQAENNIPVVGKDQVARGREMHWIRVDRYFAGDLDAPEVAFQPVPCMHCEQAPCEVVCPVNATVHSSEGLNEMVYNRCVGTRYCSNNCPYKVRRFNFYLYSNWRDEPVKMAMNPDVTVRSRGVMEKCSYCVQRIEHTRIRAGNEGRPIRDGEIVTACQQACPAEAIVFGDVNDPQSRVATLKAEARNYALLSSLNTRPRTTYLAGIKNPNPALAIAKKGTA